MRSLQAQEASGRLKEGAWDRGTGAEATMTEVRSRWP